jgi:hypothetical protein
MILHAEPVHKTVMAARLAVMVTEPSPSSKSGENGEITGFQVEFTPANPDSSLMTYCLPAASVYPGGSVTVTPIPLTPM